MVIPLLESARKVVAERQCQYIDNDTGQLTTENAPKAIILDGITASLITQVFDGAKHPEKFSEAIDKVGVARVVTLFWKAVRK